MSPDSEMSVTDPSESGEAEESVLNEATLHSNPSLMMDKLKQFDVNLHVKRLVKVCT